MLSYMYIFLNMFMLNSLQNNVKAETDELYSANYVYCRRPGPGHLLN